MVIFIKAIFIGIIAALAAVVLEQLLAVAANVFLQREITSLVYTNLSFFLVAAAIIEEGSKYFFINYGLRRLRNLGKFRFVLSAAIAGLFFGLTEVYFVLLANGRQIADIGRLGKETLFSLAGVLLLHTLTILLMAALISTRRRESRLGWLKILIFPVLVHLLFNFLVIQRSGFTNWLIALVLAITLLASVAVFAFNREKNL